MRWTWAAVLASTVTTVHADDDDPGRDPAPSEVHGKLVDATAHLVAHVGLDVTEPRDTSITIDLPQHAVITAATATVEGVSHPLALVPSAQADAAYTAVLHAPVGANPGWAVRLVGEPTINSLSASVIVPRPVRIELVLDLEAPACFFRDERYIAIPQTWRAALDPALARTPVAAADALTATCSAPSDMTWIAFPSSELAAHPPGEARIGSSGERLNLARHPLSHLELDIARELGAVPDDLYTAIVIDGSRSLSASQADAQRAIVESYLNSAPNGRVQVIAYTRGARALLPAWAVAEATHLAIDRAIRALPPRNGSDLDAGLTEAAVWLARVRGTRRVIAFTDELVASRLDGVPAGTDRLAKLLPADALVHVVALQDFRDGLSRADDGRFAALAAKTAGLSVRAGIAGGGELDATMLARPISLDHLVLTTKPGWGELRAGGESCADHDALHEGTSCQWWGEGDFTSGAITVTGMIWGRPFRRVIVPDAARALTLARTLSTLSGIETALAAEVDVAARAANSAWSLFAKWGGRDGYAPREDTGFGYGRRGTGSSGSSITDTIGTALRPGWNLRAQLQPAIDRCHPGDARLEVAIETTLQEIVDVSVEISQFSGSPQAGRELHDCVVDGVWATMLTIANAPSFARSSVTFGGK
jgi:hypothetical protein